MSNFVLYFVVSFTELHDFTLSSLDENEETLYLSQMEDETLPSAIVDRNASSSVLPPQYEVRINTIFMSSAWHFLDLTATDSL